jgi:hypothetical protein
MWRDQSVPRAAINNVLVVSIRRDAAGRRNWEDGFVSSLRAHGVKATASYTIFPAGAPDTSVLAAAVRGTGYDGVLLSHQVEGSTEARYVPGYGTTEPVYGVNLWSGHYSTYYARVYSPGYIETDQIVRYETELYLTRARDRLVWTGTTESINPSSSKQINGEIADIIVPAMIKAGVVQAR